MAISQQTTTVLPVPARLGFGLLAAAAISSTSRDGAAWSVHGRPAPPWRTPAIVHCWRADLAMMSVTRLMGTGSASFMVV